MKRKTVIAGTAAILLAAASSLTLYFYSAHRTISYNGVSYPKTDLSRETVEWLEWYQGLPEESQQAISYIPAELQETSAADSRSTPMETD